MKTLQVLKPQKFDFLLIPLLTVSSLFLSACYLNIIIKINGYSSSLLEAIQTVVGGTIYLVISIYMLLIFWILTFFLIRLSTLIKNQIVRMVTLIFVSSIVYYYIIQIFV